MDVILVCKCLSRALQGKSPNKIKQEVQETWFLALSAGWKFWPLIHMVTFSSLIPHDLKLLFVGEFPFDAFQSTYLPTSAFFGTHFTTNEILRRDLGFRY